MTTSAKNTNEPPDDEQVAPGTTERAEFKLVGLDCPSCAAGLDATVSQLAGVVEARTDFASATLRVTYDPIRCGREQIIERVRQAGYDAADLGGETAEAVLTPAGLVQRIRRQRRLIATAASLALLIAAAIVDWRIARPTWLPVALYLAATAVGGFYVLRAALLSLRARRLDMNVLMTIAVAGAIVIGYWSEAATVTFLFALSLWLEQRTMDRARNAIRSLLKLKPDRVRLLSPDGRERLVPPEQVQPGQQFQVRPTERVGLDGQVVSGDSSVDQSAVTGESMPVARGPGDAVLAGTINLEATLTVRATREAGQSTISRIIQLVEQAQAARAPAQRFVDRFARIYTPLVVVLAVLVAAVPPLVFGAPFWEPADAGLGEHGWLYRALVLLVIACPCALVISTPVSIVAALASAARRGVLIKGGIHLETLGRVHCVVFDKTGTLTAGRPRVTDVVPLDGADPPTLLRLAAALESHSEHPLARAILDHARESNVEWPAPAAITVLPGRGVEAALQGQAHWLGNQRLARERGADLASQAARVAELEADGKTVVVVGRGGQTPDAPAALLGLIAVADQLRPSARDALAHLRQTGHGLRGAGGAKVATASAAEHRAHMVMLTGDNRTTARAIAEQLGIDSYLAELLPDEKVSQVRRLAYDCTGAVAMVGDGINDAPALAAANLGIAMGAGGTDAALQTADVALIGDDLGGIPFAVRLGQRTGRVIAQNVWFSIIVKAVFFALALGPLPSLWLAVFADMGASLAVIANGLRLLRVKR